MTEYGRTSATYLSTLLDTLPGGNTGTARHTPLSFKSAEDLAHHPVATLAPRTIALTTEAVAPDSAAINVVAPTSGQPLHLDAISGAHTLAILSGVVIVHANTPELNVHVHAGATAHVIIGGGRHVNGSVDAGGALHLFASPGARGSTFIAAGSAFSMEGDHDQITFTAPTSEVIYA